MDRIEMVSQGICTHKKENKNNYDSTVLINYSSVTNLMNVYDILYCILFDGHGRIDEGASLLLSYSSIFQYE